jgi:hypothetical protein
MHCSLLCVIRTLRLGLEEVGADGVTLSVAALRVPVPDARVTAASSPPNRDLVVSLYLTTSKELAAQELTSHLVSLLGALLLQDTRRISSRGRREESTPATTPTRSFGAAALAIGQSDKNAIPAPILVVCYELLVALNSFCCFDLETSQKLPQDLKVSTRLVSDARLLV